MEEVDADAVHNVAEVVERGDERYLRLPVEVFAPVLADFLERPEIEAVLPAGAGNLVRPARSRQPLAQIVYRSLRIWDGKRFDRHVDCPTIILASECGAWNFQSL